MNSLIQAFKSLENWFFDAQRILPWRKDSSVYRVWISEIMLQQTQVKTVIPYFEKFIHRFPDVKTLAGAQEDEVMLYWAGLGYYSRARNLHKAAKRIVELKDFPNTKEDWLALPGIGNYTAGAILSIALNQPEAILDGNVERILCRLRMIEDPRENKARLWKISGLFVRLAYAKLIRPSVFNQAMMELGATICSPRNPDCGRCPLVSICKANRKSLPEYFPAKRAKKWEKITEEAHCIIDSKNRLLLLKSSGKSWRSGLYDFPVLFPDWLKDKKFELAEKIQTQHVVTHHKILRITSIWRIKEELDISSRPEFYLLDLKDSRPIQVAVGSAFRKTLKKVREVLG